MIRIVFFFSSHIITHSTLVDTDISESSTFALFGPWQTLIIVSKYPRGFFLIISIKTWRSTSLNELQKQLEIFRPILVQLFWPVVSGFEPRTWKSDRVWCFRDLGGWRKFWLSWKVFLLRNKWKHDYLVHSFGLNVLINWVNNFDLILKHHLRPETYSLV